MAPLTLRSIERGSSTVTFGAYISVMQVLGLLEDLNLLAKEDEIGRHLQDAKLIQTKLRKRVDRKEDHQNDGMPNADKHVKKAKEAGGNSGNLRRKRTSSAGPQASPPIPAPKKAASTKELVRNYSKRETAASKLAAEIFKNGEKAD